MRSTRPVHSNELVRAVNLDFEGTIEKCMLDLRRRFWIREARFDPFQMQATAQRLVAAGLPMVEFAQTTANLTEASSNLYELFKGKNLSFYADADIRLAVSRVVAVESARGWKISKRKPATRLTSWWHWPRPRSGRRSRASNVSSSATRARRAPMRFSPRAA